MNDIKNEEKQSCDLIDENRIKKFKQMIVKNRKHFRMFEFHVVQNFWRFVIKFLTRKIDHFNLCELKCWSCVDLFIIHVNTIFYDNFYDNLHNYIIKRRIYVFLFFKFFYDNFYDNSLTNDFWRMFLQKEKIYDIFSFHFYFIRKNKAIWRNFATWNITIEYMKLSNFVFWWFDDYDFRTNEWKIDLDFETIYEAASMILKNYDDVSSKFEKYLSNENILTLLSKFTVKNIYFNFK